MMKAENFLTPEESDMPGDGSQQERVDFVHDPEALPALAAYRTHENKFQEEYLQEMMLERRGKIKEAGDQWKELIKLADGPLPPKQIAAATEWYRMDRGPEVLD